MTKFVKSNADLPKTLNSDAKQIARAKTLAEAHLGVKAKKAKGPRVQGFFSRTMKVTMDNGEEAIIQFRVEPLDVASFHQARDVLGPVVPNIKRLQDAELDRDGIATYFMTCMPGKTWLESNLWDKWDPKMNVEATKSLGRILSQGYVLGGSEAVVDSEIKGKLEQLLKSKNNDVQRFRADIQRLLSSIDKLKYLPLWVSHADLNYLNILVEDSGQVSGIVDWELSKNLPFGVGLSRVHDLAGKYRNRMFHMPKEFEEAERGFWEELFGGIPTDIKRTLLNHLREIEMAVHVGTLLDTLDQGETLNQAALNSLPLLLTYRIPALRGDGAPFPTANT